MIFTTFSVPTLQTPAIRARRWWANGGQEITLRAIERGAEMFSNFLTQLMLDAIDSGIIVRRWWENRRKDQAVELAWFTARTIALLVMFIACLVCTILYFVPVAAHWVRNKGVPLALRSLDKTVAFILCYEDSGSSQLAQGVSSSLQIAASSSESIPVADSSSLTGITAEELIDWSVQRWPQLKRIG